VVTTPTAASRALRAYPDATSVEAKVNATFRLVPPPSRAVRVET
jgi:hypothetical protein